MSAHAQVFITLVRLDGTNGSSPEFGSLVQGLDGSLYGTTSTGGAYNDGTIFKLTREGGLATLHSFDLTDGAYPYAGLVQATNGNLYGTTSQGGAYSSEGGTVFEIAPTGTLATLYSFCPNQLRRRRTSLCSAGSICQRTGLLHAVGLTEVGQSSESLQRER